MSTGALGTIARHLLPARRSGRATVLALSVALPALAVALHTGWGRSPAPWQQATGWDRIDPALRPAAPRSRFVLGPRRPGEAGEAVELHWLGHSGFLLEWRGVRLLLDPNTNDRCSIAPRLLEPAVDLSTLGPIDAALVSHAHYDHMDLPSLGAVPDLGMIIVPAGSEEYVAGLGAPSGAKAATAPAVSEIIGLGEGISAAIGPLTVTAVHARHNGNRHHPLASRHLAVGYVIRAGGEGVYFAGDTGDGPQFEAIGAEFHPRLAILPIGAFSPAVPIGLYHLSPEQAVSAGRRLGAEVVVPCHFGTFVLALDRATTALPRFARAADAAGLSWAMPVLLTERSSAPVLAADRGRR